MFGALSLAVIAAPAENKSFQKKNQFSHLDYQSTYFSFLLNLNTTPFWFNDPNTHIFLLNFFPLERILSGSDSPPHRVIVSTMSVKWTEAARALYYV
jgi:hypothetical protein